MEAKQSEKLATSASNWGSVAMLVFVFLVLPTVFYTACMSRNQFGFVVHGNFNIANAIASLILNPIAWFSYFAWGRSGSLKRQAAEALKAENTRDQSAKEDAVLKDRVEALERQIFEKK